jgi:3-phenylpropionate/trans-cinnamate dioxygenase ferredoxin component
MTVSESEFVQVARVGDIPDYGSLLVEVADRMVVLIRAGKAVYALDDVCTHDGGPLSDGELDFTNCTIACPRHGAKFDLRTGAVRAMPATEPTAAHEVRIEGENVLVRLNDA